jgi:hypothetical protein
VTETVLVGIVSGFLGVLAAAIPAYLSQRNAPSRRVNDTASIVDASGRVVTTLRDEIDRLDSELAESRRIVRALEDHVDRLEEQVKELGGTPIRIVVEKPPDA